MKPARMLRSAPYPALNPFELGYVEAALWSTSDDDDEALERNFSIEDIAPDTLQEMRDDCTSFMKININDLEELQPERAGALFWFSRNEHGTGFWDEDSISSDAAKARLDKCSDEFGPVDLYVGDDGFVHA